MDRFFFLLSALSFSFSSLGATLLRVTSSSEFELSSSLTSANSATVKYASQFFILNEGTYYSERQVPELGSPI